MMLQDDTLICLLLIEKMGEILHCKIKLSPVSGDGICHKFPWIVVFKSINVNHNITTVSIWGLQEKYCYPNIIINSIGLQ